MLGMNKIIAIVIKQIATKKLIPKRTKAISKETIQLFLNKFQPFLIDSINALFFKTTFAMAYFETKEIDKPTAIKITKNKKNIAV